MPPRTNKISDGFEDNVAEVCLDSTSSKPVDKQPTHDGLSGKGIAFGLYSSTVESSGMKSQTLASATHTDAAHGEGILVTIREGVTKGHIVEVRENSSAQGDGLTGMLDCCKCGYCGGGGDGLSVSGDGFKTWTFSTKDIDYVKVSGSANSASTGGEDLGCCGNCCLAYTPTYYYGCQTFCGPYCKCCAADGTLTTSDSAQSLEVHLRFGPEDKKVVVPIKYAESNNHPVSDSTNCCKPWKLRETTVNKQTLKDGTKVRTTNWTEEEQAPTCSYYKYCYNCEHETCGVPTETKSFVIQTKYIMDKLYKEHCEIKGQSEMESLSKILMHLMTQDRD